MKFQNLATKFYLKSFRFLTHSLLRGFRWAVLRAWTQNHPKVVGICPSHHPQPIGQNRVFKIERPGPRPPTPPLNITTRQSYDVKCKLKLLFPYCSVVSVLSHYCYMSPNCLPKCNMCSPFTHSLVL